MSPRSLLFAAFTLLFATATTAQGTCPNKQAKFVPETLAMHGELPCSGGTISFGGLTISSENIACPIFATHIMPHEIEVDALTETMVELTGTASSWIYYFACQQDWFLILPWGSSCVMKSRAAGASMPRYRTVPCGPITP
jgi:hypothetical protein